MGKGVNGSGEKYEYDDGESNEKVSVCVCEGVCVGKGMREDEGVREGKGRVRVQSCVKMVARETSDTSQVEFM